MHTIKIRRKITSSNLRISELKDFMGKYVEITVRESLPGNNFKHQKTARGILSNYNNPELLKEEKKAWKSVITKKYGNS